MVLRLFPLLVLSALVVHGQSWQSSRVVQDVEGRLTYPIDARGNRMPDFSNAGYKGGGVPFPTGTVRVTLSSGANAAQIAAAIASAASAGTLENPGVVLLGAGTYTLTGSQQILLNQNNVILRGMGNGTDPASNTIIRHSGTSQISVIVVGGTGSYYWTSTIGSATNITDDLVQVGSRTFSVANASTFQVGDAVLLRHPSTLTWLTAFDFGGVPATSTPWGVGTKDVNYHRIITGIVGNTVTVDAPLFMDFKKSLSQSNMIKFNNAGRLSNIGVENVRVDCDPNGTNTSTNHANNAVVFQHGDNFWATDVIAEHFGYTGIYFTQGISRSTAKNCQAVDPHKVSGGDAYSIHTENGQLILFEDCYASGARHPFTTNSGSGAASASGVVFLDCTADGQTGIMHGHTFMAQGVLYDGVTVNTGPAYQTCNVALANNGNALGSGNTHGWGNVNSVLWNVKVTGTKNEVVVQEPPLGQNYAIGVIGGATRAVDSLGTFAFGRGAPSGIWTQVVQGHVEGTNVAGLTPASLYRAQVADRLGNGQPPPGAGPQPPLASGLEYGDIGDPLFAGDTTYDAFSGTYSVSAAGADVWNSSDQFHFARRSSEGNVELVVRVTSVLGTNPWAKAGLMIRSSRAANASHVFVFVTPQRGVMLQWRSQDGAASDGVSIPGVFAPVWLKLKRGGSVFTAWYSVDAITWIEIGSRVVDMTGSTLAGLATTSHESSLMATTVYSGLEITESAIVGELPAAPSALTIASW